MERKTNREIFLSIVTRQLLEAAKADPMKYSFWFKPYESEEMQLEAAKKVADKVTYALSIGTASKDGAAVVATCKELKIPNTYQAIKAYLQGEQIA